MSATAKKLVLITGGAKGIGLSISRQLAREGHDLVLWGRDQAALASVATALQADHGVRVRVAAVDLAVTGAASAALGRLVKEIALPDALISNAGDYGMLGRMGEIDFSAWKKSFDLNFFSAAELVHTYVAAAGQAPSATRRKIVLMGGSGLGGANVWPGISAYGCSKAALYRLVEVVHEELHARGIDINCVAPGAVKTGITDQALHLTPEALGPLYQETLKVQASGGDNPELAGRAIAALLSPRCDGFSGRLVSAKWDGRFLESEASAQAVNADRDLLRLRRIDQELFGRMAKK